jgi:hypothetical protein
MGSSNNCGNNSSNSNNCGSSDSSSDNSSARNAKVGEANGRLVGWNIYRLTRCPPDTTSEQGQHIHDCIWHTMTGCGMSVLSHRNAARSSLFCSSLFRSRWRALYVGRKNEGGNEMQVSRTTTTDVCVSAGWLSACIGRKNDGGNEMQVSRTTSTGVCVSV